MLIEDIASKLYPPRSNSDLRKLHESISASSSPQHHKQSTIYYLLLDLSLPRRSAAAYARHVSLPPKYATLVDGLWQLDRLELERALDSLTQPSLLPTFPEEIVSVLCKHATGEQSHLALAYFYSVEPKIQDIGVRDEVFRCMIRASLTEAFFYARSQGDPMHRHLFEEMLGWTLESGDHAKGKRAVEMVQLPFSEEEEEWFEDFLIDGRGSQLPKSRDTAIMRRLLIGNVDDAKELSKRGRDTNIEGTTWRRILEGIS